MIDDLTLKARLMAADANELQKILPGGRKRPGWMPGSDKRRMGADNYNKLNEQQQNAQRGMQAHQKTESQNQAVADYRSMTANTPGIPFAAVYEQTAGGNTRGPKPTPANAYAKSARQQAKLQAQNEEGMQEPGENGSTVIPDQKTQVQSFNDKGEVVSNTTKETNKPQVPENTEQGGGNPNQDQSQTPQGKMTHNGKEIQLDSDGNYSNNGVSITNNQSQGDPRLNAKTNEAMALMEGVQARKKERLASEQTSPPAPAPAIPGSPPAPAPAIPGSPPAPAPAIPGSPPAPAAQTQQPLGGPMPQTAPTGAPAPPPPNMAAPLPPLNAGHMNTGGQQNNPVFNIGTQGQGQGQGQGQAPQNDPRTNARNAQVQAATKRANTKGGIGTGIVSNALTFGLAGAARGAYNAYERGQGRQQLAQMAKSPYSKVLSVFEIRKGISARNTTEVLRRGRI
jgi:hypothetical protein